MLLEVTTVKCGRAVGGIRSVLRRQERFAAHSATCLGKVGHDWVRIDEARSRCHLRRDTSCSGLLSTDITEGRSCGYIFYP